MCSVSGKDLDSVQEGLEEELKDYYDKKMLRFIRIYHRKPKQALLRMDCAIGVLSSENNPNEITELKGRLNNKGFSRLTFTENNVTLGCMCRRTGCRMANHISNKQAYNDNVHVRHKQGSKVACITPGHCVYSY